MKKAIKKDNTKKVKIVYVIAIIVGILLAIYFFPLWVFYIIIVQTPGWDLALIYVLAYAIPVIVSIGFILYGIINILNQKNRISDKSINIFKIVSHLFLYIGLAILIVSMTFGVLFTLLRITLPGILLTLAIFGYFLLFLGFCIPSKVKRKDEENV